GAAGGSLLGHFARGMSRKDVKELGDTLDEGQAALIVVGRDKLSEKQDKIASRARKQIERELDISGSNLDAELAAATDRM
ncbi:MAG TPA: hypothetical protein VFX70_10685, partial [Mycobacteriales bacterium]|nr:hypothetical protein [Mycobacteriales bacterium]